MTRNQLFAFVSAAIYFAAGVIGFLITGVGDFAGAHHEKIIVLSVNPLHNTVHVALGAAWLIAALLPSITRIANIVLGFGLLAAFVLGVAGGAGFLNIHSVGEPDNYLHLVYGLLSIAVGWRVADPAPVRTSR
ncbi:DUF4383 domain-containing protein [Nocardia rhizosphaerae]|uniref:DUF4383 domain-containing protein n=1 Tax=Nocardia rhizosphaerae TaxID=1691571 RepID=A0ABV8L3V2_9NOCA